MDATRVFFKNHRIYSHKIMRVRYMTYDVRRGEDVLHIDGDVCNIMIANPKFKGSKGQDRVGDKDISPYLYARVLGIYHGEVGYSGELSPGVGWPLSGLTNVEFLWVRWYDTISKSETGSTLPLDCVRFRDIRAPNATGFVNAVDVLRAAHIIPRFSHGKLYPTGQGLSKIARDGADWCQYYVNRYISYFTLSVTGLLKPSFIRFADRDMFMRYQIGFAVGHTTGPIAPDLDEDAGLISVSSPGGLEVDGSGGLPMDGVIDSVVTVDGTVPMEL